MKLLVILLLIALSGCVSKTNKDTNEKALDKSYQTLNYEYPSDMDTQIHEILVKHKDDILSLDDIKSIDLSDISPDTIYEYESTDVEKLIYKYSKNESGFWYFDLLTYLDGQAFPSIYRTNGFKSEVSSIDKPDKFSDASAGFDVCKYALGSCEYKQGKNTETIERSFENGVWTSQKPMGHFGVAYYIKKEIYDKNGMLLYRGYFSNRWTTGKHSYTIRLN